LTNCRGGDPSQRPARGRAIPWPPQRTAACWCGSGRGYGECHGVAEA
ncbi:SEC-C domain-containing protein, partial [Streptomyces sp. XM83C]